MSLKQGKLLIVVVAVSVGFGVVFATLAHGDEASNVGVHQGSELPISLPNGVSVGDVGVRSAVLWARSSIPGEVRFSLVSRHLWHPPVDQIALVSEPMVPAKVRVTGLRPHTRYTYTATAPDGESFSGSFRTAPRRFVNRVRGGIKFGVSGDWRGELAPYPAISNVPGKELDFFVKLGDTYYADYSSPAVPLAQASTLEEFRAKNEEVYAEHFGVNSWSALQSSTAILSTIDDHEVTDDFAGGAQAHGDSRFSETTGLINETELYANGLQSFSEYNAIQDLVYPVVGDSLTDGRPDLYRDKRYGKIAAFFMLDARSFRDEILPGVANSLDRSETGAFVSLSFDIDPVTGASLPSRTMLSLRQRTRLMEDLLNAENSGVIWKFVLVPEPIQNLGVLAASDRFEGYAAERSILLRFIDENDIRNVVFVAADIHGTVVNNLTYQRWEDIAQALADGDVLAAPQIETSAFEISAGAVAFDAPFGPTVLGVLVELAATDPNLQTVLNLLFASVGVDDFEEFLALPDIIKNAALQVFINVQLKLQGYNRIGLRDATRIDATLIRGLYSANFSYGWTEFSLSPRGRRLRVSTYGIESYTEADLLADPDTVIGRIPRILSEFVVRAQ